MLRVEEAVGEEEDTHLPVRIRTVSDALLGLLESSYYYWTS